MPQSPSLIFQQDFHQAIWQMALEPDTGLLALELRDVHEASACFSLLNLYTKELVFDRYAFEEEWWVSLVALKDNLLLIKQYHDSQRPELQGLMAINIDTMEVQWWLNNFQLLQLQKTTVVGKLHGEGDGHLAAYSLQTGEEVSADPEPGSSGEPSGAVRVFYPGHYDAESPHFTTIASFVSGQFSQTAFGACDYLELGNLIVLSWFWKDGTGLSNALAVLDTGGQVLLHEKIGTGLDALASDTFFVFENKLIFVANKTQLRIYEL